MKTLKTISPVDGREYCTRPLAGVAEIEAVLAAAHKAGAYLAAGIGAIGHGNDIGGSLRWPAHCNGIVTIKPTQGRIPAYNESAPAERPMLAHLMSAQGPLARSVVNSGPWFCAPLSAAKRCTSSRST